MVFIYSITKKLSKAWIFGVASVWTLAISSDRGIVVVTIKLSVFGRLPFSLSYSPLSRFSLLYRLIDIVFLVVAFIYQSSSPAFINNIVPLRPWPHLHKAKEQPFLLPFYKPVSINRYRITLSNSRISIDLFSSWILYHFIIVRFFFPVENNW